MEFHWAEMLRQTTTAAAELWLFGQRGGQWAGTQRAGPVQWKGRGLSSDQASALSSDAGCAGHLRSPYEATREWSALAAPEAGPVGQAASQRGQRPWPPAVLWIWSGRISVGRICAERISAGPTQRAQAAQRAAGPTQPLGVLVQSALLCCHRFSIVNRLRQSIYLLLVCKPKSFCMYIYTLVLMIRTNPTPGQLPATRAAAASWVGQRHSCRFGHEQPDLQSWAASLWLRRLVGQQ